jgi:dethiobiotin synthetase
VKSEHSHHHSYFVTGTDTEVGKTLVSCALLHGLRKQGLPVVGMKPVAAGAELRGGVWHNEDVDLLQANSSVQLPTELVAPYLFRIPAAPHLAAQHEPQPVQIDLELILARYQQLRQHCPNVLVEGVGGFRVPFSDDADSADLAVRLALPVILVVGIRLGCINHALLTAEAIAVRGLTMAGWVANTVDTEMRFAQENIDALRERIDAPLLGTIPRLALPNNIFKVAAAASFLDFSRLGPPARPGHDFALNMTKPNTIEPNTTELNTIELNTNEGQK